MRIADHLRVMALNYANGHEWDSLDSNACNKAADELERMELQIGYLHKRLRAFQSAWDSHDLKKQLCEIEVQHTYGCQSMQLIARLTAERNELLTAIGAIIVAQHAGPMTDEIYAAWKQGKAAITKIHGGAA